MQTENPVAMLSREHAVILKVVEGLGTIDGALAAGQTVDVPLIGEIVDFMRQFADKCHHAKEEDILFPAMEAKGVPKEGCPLGALRAEHVKGRGLVGDLEQAAADYLAGDPNAADAMREAIAGIRRLYPDHIWKEDEMVFPMSERLFNREELQRMGDEFGRAEETYGRDHLRHEAFADGLESRLRDLQARRKRRAG